MQFLMISSAKCATVWPENLTSPSVVGNITVRVVSQKLLEMESLAQIPSVGKATLSAVLDKNYIVKRY